MYPQKVLQGIPDLKRAVDLRVFYLLVVPKGQAQLVRCGLLGEVGGLPGRPQILTRYINPLLR